MLLLRHLHPISAVNSDSSSTGLDPDTITSATVNTMRRSPNRTTYSNTTSVSRMTEPSSLGQVTTTVNTTTVRTNTSSAREDIMSTNKATKSTTSATGRTTLISRAKGGDTVSPVSITETGHGVNTAITSTAKDAVTGSTMVTTTAGTDADMNGSASRATTWVTPLNDSDSRSMEHDTLTLTPSVSPAKIQDSTRSITESKLHAEANTQLGINSVISNDTTNPTKTAKPMSRAVPESGYKGAATEMGATTTDKSAASGGPSVLAPSVNPSTRSDYDTSLMSQNSSLSLSSLTSWFHETFRDDETQLVVGNMSSTGTATAALQVCAGLPALVTRCDSETPNGGCPDALTALNASCTCLTGYRNTALSWAFHLTTESRKTPTSAFSKRFLTQSSIEPLIIDTIRPLQVPSSVKTLELKGSGKRPAPIAFVNDVRDVAGSSLALVKSNTSNVSTLSIHNIDLHLIAMKRSSLIPSTVTNLTLRNCNISTLNTSFTRNWSLLRYLDLSSNNLETEYIGGPYLQELNLSYNALSVFPQGSLNTRGMAALYIQGNDIQEFNISQEVFQQIQHLSAFTADKPNPLSSCEQGVWKIAHGIPFCVLGASTAAAPDVPPSLRLPREDNHGLGALSYGVIVGALAVFVLLLLIIRQHRRRTRERNSSVLVSPEAIEVMTPKIGGNTAFHNALNRTNSMAALPTRDAVAYPDYGHPKGSSPESDDVIALGPTLESSTILTSCRLDYDEVALGRCISRGGFGLVFLGCYRGRQVAVKKIRNERQVTRDQVEQFMCEITLIAGLRHPRIVDFIGACWTTPTELSAVTELMERGDLREVTQRFKRSGYRLTWASHKTTIAFHIAQALTYLHSLTPTVIHRDLKAKNVLLNADMEAKLSDFGIARERTLYDGSEHMTVGIGTSFWIAPEVLLGRDYDERADIYSFGVVLSEIDTDDYPYWNAQHPPQGKARENAILRLVARGAKRPSFSESCPPAIYELARRCLRADPADRPSASDIVTYLQQLVQEKTPSASFSSRVQPQSSNQASTHRSSVGLGTSIVRVALNQTLEGEQATSNATLFKQRPTTTITPELASTLEKVAPSPQVTHQVLRATLPSKVKQRTTTNTTTKWRTRQYSTHGHPFVPIVTGAKSQNGGAETLPKGPTSPSNIPTNCFNRQAQLSSSSGKEATRQPSHLPKYVVYEDVKEL